MVSRYCGRGEAAPDCTSVPSTGLIGQITARRAAPKISKHSFTRKAKAVLRWRPRFADCDKGFSSELGHRCLPRQRRIAQAVLGFTAGADLYTGVWAPRQPRIVV